MLKLRYPAVCTVCGTAVAAGTSAWWDKPTREVTCVGCLGVPGQPPAAPPPARELDRGRPGASARREYLRRRHNREARVRSRHPRIARWLLAFRGAPGHESSFLRGAAGEEAVARSLERRTAKGGTIILNDRAMPHSRANIDHLAIAPTGVYVIDAKDISGKVRVSRPLFGAAKLLVEGRNRSKLVDGLDRQVAAVRQALTNLGRGDVPARGVFCFTARADFPLLGPLEIRGHRLHHRRALARKLNRRGPLGTEAIRALADALASAFPSA
jgi:Nuclease-related domain